ncbi:hypothetical protein MBLNU459_g6842t3 [Dothideomycetes sp. NU459]
MASASASASVTTSSDATGSTSPPVTSVIPLSTTFTPASSCAGFTFSPPIYNIWYNEPVVASTITASACYPSQFLDGYVSTEISSSERSSASLLGPLVCPSGWSAMPTSSSTTYIACCPSGFSGIAPPRSIDHARPSYGGTCYSGFTSGQWLTVTEYDASSLIGTKTLSQTVEGQVYAHVIDGLVGQGVLQTSSSTPASVSASPTPATSASASASASTVSKSKSLSGGAIAGIVIGVLAALALIVGAALVLVRRRKASVPISPITEESDPGHESGAQPIYESDAAGAAVHEKDAHGDKQFPLGRFQSELSGSEVGHEMESPPPRAELEGDYMVNERDFKR